MRAKTMWSFTGTSKRQAVGASASLPSSEEDRPTPFNFTPNDRHTCGQLNSRAQLVVDLGVLESIFHMMLS